MSALRSALVFQSTTTAISPMLLSNTRILLANSDRCGFRYICNSVTPGNRKDHYRAVVVGAGTAGSAVAAKLCRSLGRGNVAVIEPSEDHYYQPMFTLVGAGLKPMAETKRSTATCLPNYCHWHRETVASIDPVNNGISTSSGHKMTYDFLVLSTGITPYYDGVKGLQDALDNDPTVLTNYSYRYVEKTFEAIQRIKSGNALFTFPATPIKCPGAPQKILYLAEEYFSKHGTRSSINVSYNSAAPVVFGVPKYAKALANQMATRNIECNLKQNLVEVRYKDKIAVFQNVESKQLTEKPYDLLHVGPPHRTAQVLGTVPDLLDRTGYVNVDKFTCRHVHFDNVFALGDCSNIPTSKTAAAISCQAKVVTANLEAVANKKELTAKYDGYTSCPLITSSEKCILAEFGFDGKIMETFPVDQSKPSKFAYFLKVVIMPKLYWKKLVKGNWNGPGQIRYIMNFWKAG